MQSLQFEHFVLSQYYRNKCVYCFNYSNERFYLQNLFYTHIALFRFECKNNAYTKK